MSDNNWSHHPVADSTSPAAGPDRPRSRLRMATIGGIAAIAIVGGGVGAVAFASTPAATSPVVSLAETTTTTLAAPADGSVASSGAVAPSSGAPAPTGAPAPAAPRGVAAPTPPTPKPHLDGTVSSVSGSTVLIKDHEGFTRSIVLGSATKYTDSLSASAIKSGTKVHAEGAVDANGTSLDATTFGLDKGPMGGPGGHGGPGGPGPRGDHPAPPAGGKAPAAPSSGAVAPSGGTFAPPTTVVQTTK